LLCRSIHNRGSAFNHPETNRARVNAIKRYSSRNQNKIKFVLSHYNYVALMYLKFVFLLILILYNYSNTSANNLKQK